MEEINNQLSSLAIRITSDILRFVSTDKESSIPTLNSALIIINIALNTDNNNHKSVMLDQANAIFGRVF